METSIPPQPNISYRYRILFFIMTFLWIITLTILAYFTLISPGGEKQVIEEIPSFEEMTGGIEEEKKPLEDIKDFYLDLDKVTFLYGEVKNVDEKTNLIEIFSERINKKSAPQERKIIVDEKTQFVFLEEKDVNGDIDFVKKEITIKEIAVGDFLSVYTAEGKDITYEKEMKAVKIIKESFIPFPKNL